MIPVEFYIWRQHFYENVGNLLIRRNAITIVRAFFWVNLLNSFDFVERAVMGLFEVAELESVLKIWVAPYLMLLGPIFAQNFGITTEH